MIFLPITFLGFGLSFGVILLIVHTSENHGILSVVESVPIKLFASWLVLMNTLGLIFLFLVNLFVPKPKVIWFNLIYVWVTSALGVLSTNIVFIYFSDDDRQLQIGSPQDITLLVGIFVAATVFSASRIEKLAELSSSKKL